MSADAYSAIDDALELLRNTGPEFGTYGMSNHGPMAAEALCALGRADATVPWTERYRRRLSDHPAKTAPINRGDWRAALSDFTRVADWAEFFEHELEQAPWPEVLSTWT